MKFLNALLFFHLLFQIANAQQLPVGTISENVDLALLEGNVTNSELTNFAGGIVVLYYYTPW